MKKKHLLFDFFEFFIIFFVFIAPSFGVEPQKAIVFDLNYDPFMIVMRSCLIVYFILRFTDDGIISIHKQNLQKKTLAQTSLMSVLTFLALQCIGLLFNFLSKIISYASISMVANPPETLFLWAWFLFSVIVLACFEEVIFRVYLPEKLWRIWDNLPIKNRISVNTNVFIKVLLEISIVLLFSIGHLYLGFIAMFSSFVSGILLRIFYIKYKRLMPICIAHSLNNITSFLVLFYVL